MVKDRVLSLSVIVFFVLMYLETFTFREKSTIDVVAPATYPRILIIIILLIALVIFIKTFTNKEQDKKRPTKDFKFSLAKYKDVILLFLIFCIHIILFSKIGFVAASLFFLFFSQVLLKGIHKMRHLYVNLAVTISITFVIYYAFTNILNVVLP